jgi:cellulose synthase/poly-beta-1,6-N-acetylglucosamine synthase-like glycosyltransferase
LRHDTNLGTAAAINTAFADATGKYVTWVSSDNVMHPRWLERLAGELDENSSLGAVYSAFNCCQQGGETREVRQGPYDPDRLLASENCYFGPSFLIRREVWQEHRGGTAHDYDSWTRVEEACWDRGLTIGYVDEPLCDYHKGDWNTAMRFPELYDAPKWQAEAMRRRAG